ncbi:MAG: lyso-ornithine lipid O-acyltransferase [Myxococcota bacterium]
MREAEETLDNLKRLAWFAGSNIYQLGWYALAVLLAPTKRMNITARAVENWSRKLAYILNIEVVRESDIPEKPGLIVSNHTSYHDIPVIGLLVPTIFISKESVKYLPIYGQAAWLVGIIFLDRKSQKSRKKALKLIEKRLSQGLFVVNFPEGTTTPAGEVRAFRKGLFRLLLGNPDIPVYPVRLKYEDPAVQWVGGEPMWEHFARTQKMGKIKVGVKFLPPIYGSQFSTAEEFAEAAENLIRAELVDSIR